MKKKILLAVAAVILAALIVWVLWANKALEVNTYVISSDRLPAGFDGYRIAQVSDLHNDTFGKNNEKLLAMLADTKPDIIAITGDIIDSRFTNVEIALAFAGEAMKIAPCYYVSGNNESRVEEYTQLEEGLLELGVVVMNSDRLEMERNGDTIYLLGVSDTSFQIDDWPNNISSLMRHKLEQIVDESRFSILLVHRPELLRVYAEYNIDLAITGHAHGGQVRIPFLGGVIAPNQVGLFPEFDAGYYLKENTQMVLSRGLGNSLFPVRINNRPEIVVIELAVSEIEQ